MESGSEIGILAKAFGNMTSELKNSTTSIDNLNREISERKKIETALRHSKENYKSIVDSVNETIFVHDIKTGEILDVNEKVLEMFGYTPEEVKDLDVGALSSGEPPYTTEDALRCIRKAAEGKPQLIEWRTKHKNGTLFWSEIFVKRAVIGGENRILAALSNITSRKQAEDALKQSEDKFKTIFENSGGAIFIADTKTSKIVECNSEAEKLLGRTRDEIIGMYQSELHPDAKADEYKKLFIDSIENKKVVNIEAEAQHKDGRIIPILISAQTFRIGEQDLIAGLFIDITKRKQVEEHISQLNNLREELLVPGALGEKLNCVTDAIVKIFNADFARVWITKPGDLCDSGCIHAEVKEGPHVCRYRDRCLHLLASSGRYTHIDGKVHRRVPFGCYKIGRVAAGEHPKFVTNDVTHDPRVHNHDWAKELGLVSFAGYRLVTAEGKPAGVLALFSKNVISNDEDAMLEALAGTTSQVIQTAAAEETLEGLNKDLEATVEELTVANRELVDFAHITAHDLKAPLRGIGALAEWIATDSADKFDEEGKKQIELLKQRSQRMYDQITSILNYSEIGRGKHEKEEIDLNGLVEEIVTDIALLENIQVSIADKLPTLVCEKMYLTQIFQNLLSNAIKYMDKPDGQITIGYTEESDFWKFSVADNGPGIEEKYFDKIFKIFQTLSAKDDHKGTGIGLAVTRKAVEVSGGKIWVESTPGQGTTFFFTLQKKKE
jgi:PAS domain S-box-containing protein